MYENPNPRIDNPFACDTSADRIRSVSIDYSFTTNAAGRVALIDDLEVILRQMSIPRHVFIQVDHAYGRMSMRMRRQNFLDSLAGRYLRDGFSLDSDAMRLGQAFARIEECHCCGSSGGLTFYDEAERPFMQLNPPSELSPAEWAGLLRPIAALEPVELSNQSKVAAESAFLCPAAATDLGINGMDCVELFKQLGEQSVETEFTIRANGVELRQSYLIQQLNESDGILECMGKCAGFHVLLTRAQRTAVMYDKGRLTLYLVGPENQVLLSVRAALNACSEPTFHSVVGL